MLSFPLEEYHVPKDVAAAVVDGLGHQAHQAAAAAAVDQVDLPFHLRRDDMQLALFLERLTRSAGAQLIRLPAPGCELTSCLPRSSAAALKDGRFPGLLPQKTQIARTGDPCPPPPPPSAANFFS